jgi:hypothetical protein
MLRVINQGEVSVCHVGDMILVYVFFCDAIVIKHKTRDILRNKSLSFESKKRE